MIKVSPVNNLTEGIRVEFSDLLDPNQDLEGFIAIGDIQVPYPI